MDRSRRANRAVVIGLRSTKIFDEWFCDLCCTGGRKAIWFGDNETAIVIRSSKTIDWFAAIDKFSLGNPCTFHAGIVSITFDRLKVRIKKSENGIGGKQNSW